MLHKFVCDDCGLGIQDTNTKVTHKCPKCKRDMRWDLHFNCSGGDYRFVSQSLAINPSQIAEHRAKFPDVNVLPDGQIEFNSVKQHSNYLDKTGFYKHPQKIKPKSNC